MGTFVDDPIVAIAGTEEQWNGSVSIVVVAWRTLNMRLAFEKAKRGIQVDWIGCALEVHMMYDEGTVKRSTVDDREQEIIEIRKHNLVSIKKLKSLAGELSGTH